MNRKIILLVLSVFIVAFAAGSVIAADAKENTEIKMLNEKTLKNGDNIELQLVDAQGNPIASQKLNISFEANGKFENYSVVTDKDGNAYLVLYNEELGVHKVIVNYTGNEKYNPCKLEENITIVEGSSTSEDTESNSTASTVQYDNATAKNSTLKDNETLFYCAEYNFYYNSDGVIVGGQNDGADAYEIYTSYKEAERKGSFFLE
ncbi:hypothetical protein [Methanobrevibacter sp. YE315]|uniref:hypothetical protein n=1 Tax=Methanobrevibacter sp. YE315 TaxID=1609968 RepID=UPI00082A5308|nr:hypothetical protein [Methanobrevibacter sp. YE315]